MSHALVLSPISSERGSKRNGCLKVILALISTVNGETIHGVNIETYGIRLYAICFKM
jgi:hypothetical protein